MLHLRTFALAIPTACMRCLQAVMWLSPFLLISGDRTPPHRAFPDHPPITLFPLYPTYFSSQHLSTPDTLH